MSKSLKTTTVRNLSYNAAGRIISFAVQSITTVVLSRELDAIDYGVIGFAMLLVNFLRKFEDLGINSAATQQLELDDRKLYTAFTVKFILALLLLSLSVALSGVAGNFFKHESLPIIIKIISLSIVINTFSMLPNLIFMRELNYLPITVAEVAHGFVSSMVSVVLAITGYKYWSLVYGYLAGNIAFVVILNVFKPCKIKFVVDKKIARYFLKFGVQICATGLLTFIVYNVDNFVIGVVAGVAQLGYYTIAFNWGSMVCSIMGAVVFGVLFPTFSRMQDDPVRIKLAYLKIVQAVALFSVLCNVGLFCVANNFLVFVLGKGTDKWLPSLYTLQILCFYGILRSLVEPATSLLMSQGNARTPLLASLLVATIETAFLYPAIKFGSIEVVGLVVLFAYLCQIVFYLPALKDKNNISALEIASTIWPAVIAGTAMFFSYLILDHLLTSGLFKLVVSCIYLSVIYVVVYGLVTKWRFYLQLRELLPVGR